MHLHVAAVHPAPLLSPAHLWPGVVLLGRAGSSVRGRLCPWGDDGALWEGVLEGARADVWGQGGKVWGLWGRHGVLAM